MIYYVYEKIFRLFKINTTMPVFGILKKKSKLKFNLSIFRNNVPLILIRLVFYFKMNMHSCVNWIIVKRKSEQAQKLNTSYCRICDVYEMMTCIHAINDRRSKLSQNINVNKHNPNKTCHVNAKCKYNIYILICHFHLQNFVKPYIMVQWELHLKYKLVL